MKYLIYPLPFLFLIACHAQQKTSENIAPAVAIPAFVTWDTQKIDLGKVRKGEKRNMTFVFTNTSGESAQVDIVDACECTTTDFPRGAIAPGGKGTITAIFDSKEKDANEVIDIRVIFRNTNEKGIPRIETLQYSFQLEQ